METQAQDEAAAMRLRGLIDKYAPPRVATQYGTDRALLIVALLLNSALYCTGVFVAGLATGHDVAWKLSLLTVGLCYLTPMMQTLRQPLSPLWFVTLPTALFALSILSGLAAGAALFIGG